MGNIFFKMKSLFLSIIFLLYSTSYAQGITGRLNTSNKIMQIYQQHCQEKSGKSKQAFELAASYIMHGEYTNMKEQLLKARAISIQKKCQKSIDDFLD